MDQYNAQSFWVSKKKGTIETEYLKKNLDHDELLIKTFILELATGQRRLFLTRKFHLINLSI